MSMLEVKDLQVYYGVIQALKGISFHVEQGEVIALIGANGAGKTTTLHTITGLLSPKKGSVMFEGTDITKIPAHKIVSMGMAHVPEGRRVFAELSVYENLKMGAYTRKDKNLLESDIVIVAVGSPMENIDINMKLKNLGLNKVIFCWNEADGVGGHSLSLDLEKSCYECLYTNNEGFTNFNELAFLE